MDVRNIDDIDDIDIDDIDDQCRGPSIKEKDHLVGSESGSGEVVDILRLFRL